MYPIQCHRLAHSLVYLFSYDIVHVINSNFSLLAVLHSLAITQAMERRTRIGEYHGYQLGNSVIWAFSTCSGRRDVFREFESKHCVFFPYMAVIVISHRYLCSQTAVVTQRFRFLDIIDYYNYVVINGKSPPMISARYNDEKPFY